MAIYCSLNHIVPAQHFNADFPPEAIVLNGISRYMDHNLARVLGLGPGLDRAQEADGRLAPQQAFHVLADIEGVDSTDEIVEAEHAPSTQLSSAPMTRGSNLPAGQRAQTQPIYRE